MSEHVFREADGKLEFVGDFDALYREDDDPWGQSGSPGHMGDYYRSSRRLLVERILNRTGHIYHGLDVGCGNGWSTKNLLRVGDWVGLDISLPAICKARQLHPRMTFYDGDICDWDCLTPHHVGKYEVVVLSELLWYILDRIDDAMANATRFCTPGGLICVSQAFLRDEQRYGAEIANGFHGALKLFLERFPSLPLIEAHYDDSESFVHHHGLMIFRKPA